MYTSELSKEVQDRLNTKLTQVIRSFNNHILGYKEYGDMGYLRDAEDILEDSRYYLKTYLCDHKIREDIYSVQCCRCGMYVSLK